MEIIRASVLGFCFGVRRAVELALQAIEENTSQKVYSLGPLIHNEKMLGNLAEKGLLIVEENEINNIQDDSVVIIRAHGVAPKVIDFLNKKNCKIIDATCPRVKASQKMVEKFTSNRDCVILTGDKNHGEVIGITGYANKNFFVIQNVEEAESLDLSSFEKLNGILLSQTTYSESEFLQIEKIIQQKMSNLTVMNTICPATYERQNSLKELCAKVDAVLVIGGKNSANTRRLYETALQFCGKAAYIQNKEEIPKEFLKLNKIGITAGASTPDFLINEIEESLKEV